MENAIVLDLGNYSYKAGIAGEDTPKSEILSVFTYLVRWNHI